MSTYMSPYLLVFGTLPRVDIYTFYEGDGSIFRSKHQYLKTIIELMSVITNIRLSHIKGRQYPANSKKVQTYLDRIQPGSIVQIKDRQVVNKGVNHKLLPRWNTEFLVIKRTPSSAFLAPCIEILLEDFTSGKKKLGEVEPTLIFQVDISNLKFKRNLTLVSSNRSNIQYRKFLQNHKLPE